MAEYQCWGDDHEDLTAKVEQAVAALPKGGGIVTFGLRWTGKDESSSHRQVMVTCTKGHENVFTVEG